MTERAELERHLATVRDDARRRWPGLEVDATAFVAHAVPRYPAGLALASWCADELYLACALLAGDSRALAIFEREYLAELDGHLARFTDAALVDDAKQVLRQRLLVALDDEPPRIASYTGKGSLAKWLSVVAMRTAISLRRTARDVPVDDDALAALQGATSDPRIAHLKRTYAAQFGDAWRRALRELAPADRTLLRLHLLERLSVDRLGALYGVHATTAARWVRQVRDRLADRVRAVLQEVLAVTGSELDDIVALIRSQIDVTLTELLSKDGQLQPDR